MLALDILRCRKIANFQKIILPPVPPFNPASRFRVPKAQPMYAEGQPTAAVWEQQGEARSLQPELVHPGISTSLLRQAGPMTPVFVQRCSVNRCRRMMSFCMNVRCCSGSLPLKTFTDVLY